MVIHHGILIYTSRTTSFHDDIYGYKGVKRAPRDVFMRYNNLNIIPYVFDFSHLPCSVSGGVRNLFFLLCFI